MWSLSDLSLLSLLLSLLSLLDLLRSQLGLLLALSLHGKEQYLLLSGEKSRSLMVVDPDCLLVASLAKPGILASASLLWSLLLLSFFVLLECRFMEEWRDPDVEGPGVELLDLLLDGEE